MSILKEILNVGFTDIILAGFVEIDSDTRIATSYFNEDRFYLEFEEYFVLFEMDEEQDEFRVTVKDEIEFNFPIDEDDFYSQTSVYDLFVIDTVSQLEITKVNKYNSDNKLKAVELILSNGQLLFLDSTYHTGIKMGGDQVKNAFVKNHDGLTFETWE